MTDWNYDIKELGARELVRRMLDNQDALGRKGLEDALVEIIDAHATASKPSVKGYTAQSDAKVALVNRFKEMEERLLREIDAMVPSRDEQPFGTALTKAEGTLIPYKYDQRWLAIARTHVQEAFMALNRAVFQPQRIKLPEDSE